MEVRIYEISNNSVSLRQIGITRRAIGSYTREKYDIGKFELTLPIDAPFADEMKIDRLLLIDSLYWGVITARCFTEGEKSQLKISGSQLKQWLHRRVFLPYENDKIYVNPLGYDSESGATETIIKAAVLKHAVEPVNIERKIFGLSVADDMKRGIEDDAYLFRYTYLDEGIKTIGQRANIGWDITGSATRCDFVFEIIPQVDCTVNQTKNKPIILQVLRHTLKASSYTEDESESSNAFYCTRSDDNEVWDKLTMLWYLDEKKKTGYQRKERALDISVDSDADDPYSEFITLSYQEMEAYRAAENMVCEMPDNMIYGVDYKLGYLCTVRSSNGIQADMEITSVKTNVSDASQTQTATFGTPKITRFKVLERNMKGGN